MVRKLSDGRRLKDSRGEICLRCYALKAMYYEVGRLGQMNARRLYTSRRLAHGKVSGSRGWRNYAKTQHTSWQAYTFLSSGLMRGQYILQASSAAVEFPRLRNGFPPCVDQAQVNAWQPRRTSHSRRLAQRRATSRSSDLEFRG